MRILGPRYLMAPLQAWDQDVDKRSKVSGGAGGVKPVLVILVDALDEADHNGRGCLPVPRLLAKE
jgi:hypothetical protein